MAILNKWENSNPLAVGDEDTILGEMLFNKKSIDTSSRSQLVSQ